MTKPTPHGQVPEALIDLIDAYAETRHRCGGIYNARTEAARKAVIEALSGMQALSAAPAVQGVPGNFITHRAAWRDALETAKAYATGDDISYWDHELAAFDRSFDRLWELMQASPTPPAEQQAAHKAAPGEREQAAQRLRELAGVSENDVTDPLHQRYIEGYKAGHAAGRKRAAHAVPGVQWQCGRQASGFAAPQQEAQEPVAAPKAAPGEPSDAGTILAKVCDLFQIGKLARTESTILTNVENTLRFSNMLGAVERDLFQQPDLPEDDDPYAEVDDNLPTPNKWGAKDEADYVSQFKAALLARGFTAPQPAPAPLSDDAKDAARYRWLRNYNTAKHPEVTEAFFLGDQNMDAAIDAALAAQKDTP